MFKRGLASLFRGASLTPWGNRKYQFMEQNLQRRLAGLKDKMPDIQKTLDTVRFLALRKDETDPIETTFELNDTLHARAEIPPTDEVYLWLGVRMPCAPCICELGLTEAGQRDVILSYRGSRGAAQLEAQGRKDKLVKLRGGLGLFEGTDYGAFTHY